MLKQKYKDLEKLSEEELAAMYHSLALTKNENVILKNYIKNNHYTNFFRSDENRMMRNFSRGAITGNLLTKDRSKLSKEENEVLEKLEKRKAIEDILEKQKVINWWNPKKTLVVNNNENNGKNSNTVDDKTNSNTEETENPPKIESNTEKNEINKKQTINDNNVKNDMQPQQIGPSSFDFKKKTFAIGVTLSLAFAIAAAIGIKKWYNKRNNKKNNHNKKEKKRLINNKQKNMITM